MSEIKQENGKGYSEIAAGASARMPEKNSSVQTHDGCIGDLSSTDYLWKDKLDHSEDAIVSVLASDGGYVYSGCDGYVQQVHVESGNIHAVNNLPDKGNHEVRLALTDSYLAAGTNGYVVLVDLADFGNASKNKDIDLPDDGGREVVSVIYDGNKYIYAGSNGYVHQIDASSRTLIATNTLPGMGNHEVQLALSDSYLIAGTNGHVILVDLADFDNPGNNIYAPLPDKDDEVVHVVTDGKYIYAGSNGYVNQIDFNGNIIDSNRLPDRGNHETRLALTDSYLVAGIHGWVVMVDLADFGNTKKNINVPLHHCGEHYVNVLFDSQKNILYAGSNGYLYALYPETGAVYLSLDLSKLGEDEVRISVRDEQVFFGTYGYLASLNVVKRLEVELIPQETEQWCWAASAEMIMKYLGRDVPQCEQANTEFKRNDCCGDPVPKECVKPGSPQFAHWDFLYRFIDPPDVLSFHDLKHEFCSNRPVQFVWKWTGGKKGAHEMVATGYSDYDQMIHINNPWPVDSGEVAWITYSEYVSGKDHTHGRDYYDIHYNPKEREAPPVKESSGEMVMEKESSAPKREEFVDAQSAAIKGLKLYVSLGMAQSEASLKSPEDASKLELGEPFQVYFIGFDKIEQFQPGQSSDQFLLDLDELMFPILCNGQVVSAVAVNREAGKWHVKSIGNSNTIKDLTRTKNVFAQDHINLSPKYFVVTIPSMYTLFLAFEDDQGNLNFVHVFDDTERAFVKNTLQNAHEVLQALQT
ncbi:papain-like cysteine protease family protein [Desulfatibacillum aliphaticivorans]|uniref:papain-like cysteine protease family protein n=1 Tax=Desulfatibacillum aliphaticivorans TaxID=218208 RepID=UPI00041FF947|nr:papain-like cysteine protease family protein [Desulfatibacillum aliphaticivorans]